MTDTIDDTDQDEPQDDVTGSAEPVNAADDAPVSIETGDPVESSSDVTDPQEPGDVSPRLRRTTAPGKRQIPATGTARRRIGAAATHRACAGDRPSR
jgi:hypothetical protein